MARLPSFYKEVKELVIINDDDLDTIELKAKVLTLDECFLLLGVDKTELSEHEVYISDRVWQKGRMKAISDAGTKLFSQMGQRGGHVPALDYLRQMSGTFSAEVTPAAGSGFKFNVRIDPEDK